MRADELQGYFCKLQENQYNWPNDYFAWQKPDGSLFMIGIHSSLFNHILVRELEPDKSEYLLKLARECNPHSNITREDLQYKREYISRVYSIDPKCTHMRNNERYDPVEELVAEVKGYQYLGTWRDPDHLMDNPHGYGRQLAHGRWDLAQKHIMGREQKPSLTDQITGAASRASSTLDTHSQEPEKVH